MSDELVEDVGAVVRLSMLVGFPIRVRLLLAGLLIPVGRAIAVMAP